MVSSKLSESQRSAFRFLRARAADGDSFTQADIEKEVGWKTGSFATYKTKHLKGYIERVGKGSFTIAPHFRRLTEDDFHGIVTQSRNTIARFVRTVFDAVLRYEFLLPLTNGNRCAEATSIRRGARGMLSTWDDSDRETSGNVRSRRGVRAERAPRCTRSTADTQRAV